MHCRPATTCSSKSPFRSRHLDRRFPSRRAQLFPVPTIPAVSGVATLHFVWLIPQVFAELCFQHLFDRVRKEFRKDAFLPKKVIHRFGFAELPLHLLRTRHDFLYFPGFALFVRHYGFSVLTRRSVRPSFTHNIVHPRAIRQGLVPIAPSAARSFGTPSRTSSR